MAQCFCGCGQKIKFRVRSVSQRGAMILGDIEEVETMLARGMDSPNAERFVEDGRLLCVRLALAVHEGVDPGPHVEEYSRGFMAFARMNFSDSAIGEAVLRSELPPREFALAVTAGEVDPFAEVEFPD